MTVTTNYQQVPQFNNGMRKHQCPPVNPSINAVKIDIHEPKVEVGQQQPKSVLFVPRTSIYEKPAVPHQFRELPKDESPKMEKPKEEKINENFPQQPQVMVQPQNNESVIKRPEVDDSVASTVEDIEVPGPDIKKVNTNIIDPKNELSIPEAQISIVIPEKLTERLASNDLKTQEQALMDIEKLYKNLSELSEKKDKIVKASPDSKEAKMITAEYDDAFDKVSDTLLDEKLITNVLNFMGRDYSNLQGPSPEKIALMSKQMTGQTLTKQEKEIVNKLSPYEQAERNEQFSLFAMNYIQSMYMEGYKKKFNEDVELVNIPGIKQMVDVVKNHKTPELRTSAIISLRLLPKREQDKELLSELFRISAEQDADSGVREAASQALADINGGIPAAQPMKASA